MKTLKDLLSEAMFRPDFRGVNNSSENDGQKYKVKRFYKHGGHKTIARGLTLSQARSHCNDPETSSSTCTGRAGKRHTKTHGHWFDGYEQDK